MTKRAFSLLALTAMLVVPLSACGSSSGTSAASSSSSAPTTSNSSSSAAPVDYHLITSGTLTVCSDVPYPPFEDFDKSTATGFAGFDVDLVTQISDALGLKLVIQKAAFDGLQSGLSLNSGQCDLVASAMTITAARAKNLDFSDPYYDSEQSLLVPAGSSITSINDLAGHKVGVQRGTTGKTFTEQNAPKGTDIISFPSDGEMYQAIQAGQVDALLQDLPVNIGHQNDPKQAGKFKVVETFKTNEQYGFAMKKGNTALVDAVNAELAKMKSDGTYQTIYDKYFATS
jgi:polar amino acid transport system substrate-binding protein